MTVIDNTVSSSQIIVWSVLGLCMIGNHVCGAFNNQNQALLRGDGGVSSLPVPASHPCKRPARSVTQYKQHSNLSPNKVRFTATEMNGKNFDWPSEDNCTDDDVTAVEPVLYDHWKLHIIMACTVTAAVEFVIIIFIILYWKQIRWTLRKITCPCDNCNQHEAMERDSNTDEQSQSAEAVDIQSDVHISIQQMSPVMGVEVARGDACDQIMQMFSAPWNSRVECGLESDDLAIPGPSGLSSPFEVVVHHDSDSDDSMVQVKEEEISPPHRTVITKKDSKGLKGQSARSKSANLIELAKQQQKPTSGCLSEGHSLTLDREGTLQCNADCNCPSNSPVSPHCHGHLTSAVLVSVDEDAMPASRMSDN